MMKYSGIPELVGVLQEPQPYLRDNRIRKEPF